MRQAEKIVIGSLICAILAVSCINAFTPPPDTTVVFETSGNEDETRTVDGTSDYFETARYQRRVARDEAVGALKGILNSASSDAVDRQEASAQIAEYAARTEKEFLTESRIAAKGFEDSVVLIGEETVTVVVKTDGLTRAQSAQIMDIVTSETKYSSQAVKIIEVK